MFPQSYLFFRDACKLSFSDLIFNMHEAVRGMQVQRLSVRTVDGAVDSPTAVLTLRPEEDPEIVDASGLTGSTELLQTLHHWKDRAPCADSGCIAVRSPIYWRNVLPVEWCPIATPAVAMLEYLRANDYAIRDVSTHPLPITDVKVVNVDQIVSRKSYLICLKKQAELAARGATAIACNKFEVYYRVLLQVDAEVSALCQLHVTGPC